jgi:hypothetical protein
MAGGKKSKSAKGKAPVTPVAATTTAPVHEAKQPEPVDEEAKQLEPVDTRYLTVEAFVAAQAVADAQNTSMLTMLETMMGKLDSSFTAPVAAAAQLPAAAATAAQLSASLEQVKASGSVPAGLLPFAEVQEPNDGQRPRGGADRLGPRVDWLQRGPGMSDMTREDMKTTLAAFALSSKVHPAHNSHAHAWAGAPSASGDYLASMGAMPWASEQQQMMASLATVMADKKTKDQKVQSFASQAKWLEWVLKSRLLTSALQHESPAVYWEYNWHWCVMLALTAKHGWAMANEYNLFTMSRWCEPSFDKSEYMNSSSFITGDFEAAIYPLAFMSSMHLSTLNTSSGKGVPTVAEKKKRGAPTLTKVNPTDTHCDHCDRWFLVGGKHQQKGAVGNCGFKAAGKPGIGSQ